MCKSVSFGGEVDLYHFQVVLGENPAVKSGAPVEMDWEPFEQVKIGFELYDLMRSGQRRRRRELSLSSRKRSEMLKRAGYSLEEIESAEARAGKAQQQRAESSMDSGLNQRFVSALQKTGMLPVTALRGVMRMAKSSTQKTLGARSA